MSKWGGSILFVHLHLQWQYKIKIRVLGGKIVSVLKICNSSHHFNPTTKIFVKSRYIVLLIQQFSLSIGSYKPVK